jgi:rare lipoprotein A
VRGLVLVVVIACGPAPSPETPPPAAPVAPPTPAVAVTVAPPPTPAPIATTPVIERGYASWYGANLAGHKTASGERFDPSKLTAAHRTLKLGTWLEVRRTDNGRVVRIRVNDRGPVSHRFIIDLSSGAARELGMLRMGVAPVELRAVSGP